MWYLALLDKPWIKYLLTLVAGVAIGAIFYPTKRVEEKISKKYEEELQTQKETHEKEIQTLNEQYTSTTQEYKSYKAETDKKVQTLTTQVSNLKSNQKTSYYKLIKPDGTIEIKKFSDSEVDESTTTVTSIQEEFKQKVASIETKWEEIHKQRVAELQKTFDQKEQTYQKKIEDYEKTKVTSVNEKKFGAEVGVDTDKQIYLHGTGDLFGPVFVGAHAASDKDFNNKQIGLGLGIKF